MPAPTTKPTRRVSGRKRKSEEVADENGDIKLSEPELTKEREKEDLLNLLLG